MNYTIPINTKDCDKKNMGGKAYELCSIYNRFDIPKGFVLIPQAFERYLSFNKIDISVVENNIQTIKDSILSGKFPKDIHKDIIEQINAMDAEEFAVRSSCVNEDSAVASYAGQYDSYLHVSVNDILNKIKKCWSSVYNERALAYTKYTSQNEDTMAVLVQEMLRPDVAGVAFSKHPVTGDNKHIVIEAVKGVAENLVQGTEIPQHVVVHKNNGDIIESHYSGEEKCLSQDRIDKITKLVLNIEIIYNKPIDVEWAIVGQTAYVLQVRPITT